MGIIRRDIVREDGYPEDQSKVCIQVSSKKGKIVGGGLNDERSCEG